MKIQRIQQQSYHSSRMTEIKRPESSVNYEGLKFRKDGFASKNCNPSFLLKMGALASAVAVATKELVFNKLFDAKTIDQIEQEGINFGKGVAESIYQNNGEVNHREIEQLIITHLGVEDASKIEVATDEDSFVEFVTKYLGHEEKFARDFYNGVKGIVIPGGTSGKLMFALKLDGLKPDVAANIAAHEFAHLLYKTSGILQKIAILQLKSKTQKAKIENRLKTSGQEVNQKAYGMQHSLQTQMLGLKDEEVQFGFVEVEPSIEGVVELSPIVNSEEELNRRLGNFVRRVLIVPGCDKNAIEFLNNYELLMKDEARAYNVGAETQKYYNELDGSKQKGVPVSRMVSILYTRMKDVIASYKQLVAQSYFNKQMGREYIEYYEPKPKREVRPIAEAPKE